MSTFGPEMCDLSAGRTYTVPACAVHFGAAQINDARQRATKTLGECALNK